MSIRSANDPQPRTATAPRPAPGAERPPADLRLLTSVPALDGMRGVAVLIVVYFHASILMPGVHLRAFAESGGLGVDAFFVLSGFLITALLMREQVTTGSVRLGGFYQRRALRLLPALVVLLAVHVVYAQVTNLSMAAERQSVSSVLFYYSNTWLHRLPVSPGLGHLWSLAVEEQFYLLWPLIFVVLLGVRRRPTTVVMLTVAAIVAVCVYRAMLFHQGTPELHLYVRLVTRADALLIGALLAQLWVRGLTPKRGLTLLAWPALAFYLFAVMHGVSGSFLYNGGYTLIAVAVALVILAVLDTSWKVNDVLRLSPLRTIGRVSYGLYIWHLFIFTAVVHYGRDWSDWTRLTVALTLCALACTASWVFVEQPFLRWKARLDRRAHLPVRDGTDHPDAEPNATVDAPGKQAPRWTSPVSATVILCIALAVGGVGLWTTRHEKYVRPGAGFAVTNVSVVVPDVTGEHAFKAVTDLADVHLNIKATVQPSDEAQGTVLSQTPAPGTRAREGTVVQVIVSEG